MKDVYYRNIIAKDSRLHIACMQNFDEPDYDHFCYLADVKFETESDTQAVIEGIYRWLGMKRFMT